MGLTNKTYYSFFNKLNYKLTSMVSSFSASGTGGSSSPVGWMADSAAGWTIAGLGVDGVASPSSISVFTAAAVDSSSSFLFCSLASCSFSCCSFAFNCSSSAFNCSSRSLICFKIAANTKKNCFIIYFIIKIDV